MELPKEFEKRMENIIPNFEKFKKENQNENIKGIKINTNKITKEEFEKIFPYKIKPIPYTNDSYYLEENPKIGNHPYHHAGLFYSQDPGASAPISSIKIEENYKVLDLCAAPGGKSIQIALQLKNGFLIANEVNSKRAKILYSNIERLGLKNVIITNDKVENLKKSYQGYFDLVLIDAPCSGEGMFRKNKEALKEWNLNNVEQCVKRQKEILDKASKMVKENGYILYSTCTYEKCENEDIIEWFTKNYNYEVKDLNNINEYTVKGLEPITKARRFYPHISKGEGQFMCLIQNKNKIKTQINTYEPEMPQNKIINEFMENLDIQLDIRIKQNKLFTYITSLPQNINIISEGVQIGYLKEKYIEPNHYLFKAYGNNFKNKLQLKLNDERIEKYLKGEEIEANETKEGWGVIMVENYPLGGYKKSNNKLKNHYPKGLRNICH